MGREHDSRHVVTVARWCGLAAALVTLAIAAPAHAHDCYQVKAGTTLYGDVMGDTEVGQTTEDVIGWFGNRFSGDPTLDLKLVALDGDVVQDEIVVHVKTQMATPVACPTPWHRGDEAAVDLTWPDAHWAGMATPTAIAQRRKQAKARNRLRERVMLNPHDGLNQRLLDIDVVKCLCVP